MKVPLSYPIGATGIPWGPIERSSWLSKRKIHRSYREDVVNPLEAMCTSSSQFRLMQYGCIIDEHGVNLPLLAALPNSIDRKPCILITGGTHGYETSGVMGALSFLSSAAGTYLSKVNVIVVPCICPWGYERIERWVSSALDPNRSFRRDDDINHEWRTAEASQLMQFLDKLTADDRGPVEWLCHIDLHETTQTDCTEFRPAKAARDGLQEYDNHIPDGFYLVGNSVTNHLEWYTAILKKVEKVTHIAEVEDDKTLSGYPATSRGLILVPARELGLCGGGCVDAKYVMTTEVYPDSERTTAEDCVKAQVEAVCGAIDFLLEH